MASFIIERRRIIGTPHVRYSAWEPSCSAHSADQGLYPHATIKGNKAHLEGVPGTTRWLGAVATRLPPDNYADLPKDERIQAVSAHYSIVKALAQCAILEKHPELLGASNVQVDGGDYVAFEPEKREGE